MLFLDEPTTGLDVQSRTALWVEVARLAREDGVTVFLTTQYLEEADALSPTGESVRSIDHGHIVRRGLARGAEGRGGAAHDRGDADRPGRTSRERLAAVSSRRFGEHGAVTTQRRRGDARCSSGETQLAELVRAVDAEGLRFQNLQLHEPTLDDVFLAKTGRSLEGAGADEEEPESAGLAMDSA